MIRGSSGFCPWTVTFLIFINDLPDAVQDELIVHILLFRNIRSLCCFRETFHHDENTDRAINNYACINTSEAIKLMINRHT
jgi:hypothetical protein